MQHRCQAQVLRHAGVTPPWRAAGRVKPAWYRGVMPPDAVDALSESLREHAYLADRGLATVLHVSLVLEKTLLLEGEAGVGKTELAMVLAEMTCGRRNCLQW